MATKSINWPAIENALFELSKDDITAFAASHSNESFYGFAYDCNAEYGQAMLCLNTPEFHQLAIDNKHLPPEVATGFENMRKELGLSPDNTSPEDRAKEIRWALGDWKYQNFSSRKFLDAWEPFQQQIIDESFANDDHADEHDAEEENQKLQESFLLAVCRVVVRLEETGAFNELNKTPNFKVFVLNHDEWEEAGWERLESVRNET